MANTGRPKTLPEGSRKILLTLTPEIIEGLDAWVEEIRATQIGGSGVTRTDLARDILARAIGEMTAAKPPKKGGRR